MSNSRAVRRRHALVLGQLEDGSVLGDELGHGGEPQPRGARPPPGIAPPPPPPPEAAAMDAGAPLGRRRRQTRLQRRRASQRWEVQSGGFQRTRSRHAAPRWPASSIYALVVVAYSQVAAPATGHGALLVMDEVNTSMERRMCISMEACCDYRARCRRRIRGKKGTGGSRSLAMEIRRKKG